MDESDPFSRYRPQKLREYVSSYCNIAVTASVAMSVGVTQDTATKGAITNPESRRAPRTIQPWSNADNDLERAIIDAILGQDSRQQSMPVEALSFPEQQHVLRVGEELVRLDSKNALLLFDADILHKPTCRIVRSLLAVETIRSAVSSAFQRHSHHGQRSLRPAKISFPTHRNLIYNKCGVKRKCDEAADPSTLLPLRRPGPADVFCILESDKDDRPAKRSVAIQERGTSSGVTQWRPPELLFVKEAKAPHKFTSEMIDKAVGIGTGSRTLDPAAIMNRGFHGSDLDELDVDECEYWFAAVCTQLYSSMIDEEGLRYGIITTGLRYIFACIDPDEPSKLRYSVASPTPDIYSSPLLRLVAFTLLAMHGALLPDGPELSLIRRRQGLTWDTGTENPSFYDDGAAPTPQTESWREPSGQRSDEAASTSSPECSSQSRGHMSSSFPGAAPGLIRSPYPSPPHTGSADSRKPRTFRDDAFENKDEAALRSRKRLRLDYVDLADIVLSKERLPTTPTISPMARPTSSNPLRADESTYCTTACLLAVRRRDRSHPACSNQAEHMRHSLPISEASQLRQHLKDQFIEDDGRLDYKFLLLKPGSGLAQPIKIRLRSHGYVLFAKAFQPGDLHTMRREAQIYNRLRSLQGVDVPVCLGTIELPLERSLLCGAVEFTSLLLLSYGGCSVEEWPHLGLGLRKTGETDRAFAQTLVVEVQKALGRIHEKGVLHRDVALRNVLLQEAARLASGPTFRLRVQLIDFERSRTRAAYRFNASRVHKPQGDDSCRDGPQSTFDTGNIAFELACAKETEICSKAISNWYRREIS